MATKHQIMLVKTIHRRLKELLGDNKVTVTVSYTSESDILRITFKKVLKGAAFELPICSSLKEYTLNPEILQHIVTDALEKMPKPPKWTMETVLRELRRRYNAYRDYIDTTSYRTRTDAVIGVGLTSTHDATQAYYSICANLTARNYECHTSDLDLFESSFERDAGLASGGEYTRWRESGEPKRWTYPVDSVRSVRTMSFAEIMAGTQAANTWTDEIPGFRVYDSVADMRPDTLFGLPVIWADELPPTQGSTNEQT